MIWSIRLHRQQPNSWVVFPQPPPGANKRATCAEGRDEMCHLTAGLRPDLCAGGLVVCLNIRWVVVLIRVKKPLRLFGDQRANRPNGQVGSFKRIGENQLRAK